jgi:hypothetical protein
MYIAWANDPDERSGGALFLASSISLKKSLTKLLARGILEVGKYKMTWRS